MAEEWKIAVAGEDLIDEAGDVLIARRARNMMGDSDERIEENAGDDDAVIDREEGNKVSEERNKIKLQNIEVPVFSSKRSLGNSGTELKSEEDLIFHNHEDLKTAGVAQNIDKLKQVALIDEGESNANINLERILEEQDTHDLYCPNCHSCITKRVILRKRKRTTREDISDAKQAKNEQDQLDCIASSSGVENKDGRHDSDPEVFRCLSCFSYFIPTASGFKLFKIFGKREESNNVQTPLEVPERSQNCLFNLCDLMISRKNEAERGHGSSMENEETEANLNLPGDMEKHDKEKLERDGVTEKEIEKIKQDPSLHIQMQPENKYEKAKDVVLHEENEGPSIRELQWRVGREETQIFLGEERREEEGTQAPQWNILKAVVYGGLLQAIAGLGIISAAAGSGVQTANVVAMGLGTLVGGVPALIHNLIQLRNGSIEDLYKQELGDKSRFKAHAVVAFLSFLFVGASQPAIYCFSFRGSGGMEQKLAAVAIASLAWVVVLAAFKAYVQELPYVLTVLFYVLLAAAASGLSFFVGAAIQMTLLRLFPDAGYAGPAASFSGALEPSWLAY